MEKTKRLIEVANDKFEISNEDILLYAQQIGIDISNEKHLLWIAKEGLSANVPEPWLIYCDEQDRVFYYNKETCEESWCHPLDKEYASLVSEERTKSKSLNSASSDYGFESKPLDSMNDPAVSSGRFPKAPLQQLSSLADAPPLSSSGKNTPPTKLGKNDGGLSNKKIEFGQIENRRRTQLAPVRLNTLKMPVPTSQKSGLGGMSFMPKGATLSKNIRRMKEETDYSDSHLEERLKYVPPNDDSNESLNSDDEGSKYSYEESDDEEKHLHGLEPYDLIDTSQLSPTHSADESPDALEINSLVQLGTKMAPSLDNSKKREQIEMSINKENSPSLSLRKVGQPSFLKPLDQASKKKESFKESKFSKKESTKKNKYQNEDETDFEDKISAINEEQRLMLEQLQREWLKMHDELEKQEKEKYEEMIKISSKKLEEEEQKLKNENSEKLSRIKNELQKKIEDENSLAEKSLQALKLSKEEKINEETEKLQKELEDVTEKLRTEIKNMEEKKAQEFIEKQKEMEETSKKELEKLKLAHSTNMNNMEKAHLAEISSLQEIHKEKMEAIQNELKNENSDSESPKHKEQKEYEDLKLLIQEEAEKYNNLQVEKENLSCEIAAQRSNLEKLNEELSEVQKLVQELQDEVDKTENDLDLLRSEKSALISELNILKENIKNEKSNLLNLENTVKLGSATKSSKECSEVGINTLSTMITALCKSSQISVSCNDASCQIGNTSSVTEASCQASAMLVTATKSSQVDIVTQTEEKQIAKSDRTQQDTNAAVDNTLEKALNGLGTKLDSRIDVIEQQLKLLQENLSKPSPQVEISSQDFIQDQFSEIPSLPNIDNLNNLPFQPVDSSRQLGHFTNNIPISSQNKCKCELGDPSSCDVMQDVKNSIYHLNNIISQNFVPPLREPSLYQVNQPLGSYSSPFKSFYAQLRDMQEKHRLTELKHKCENEVVKATKSSSSFNTNESVGYFSDKEFQKPHQSVQSNFYSNIVHDDPLIQARNLVLREQAKAWKQQQSLNSSVPNNLSSHIMSSLDSTQSSFIGLSASFSRTPISQQSFFNLEMDPETDYNNWMTRLNALQLRIRSHKIL